MTSVRYNQNQAELSYLTFCSVDYIITATAMKMLKEVLI